MSILRSALGRRDDARSVLSIDDYAEMLNTFSFAGNDYQLGTGGVTQTLTQRAERIGPDFVGLAQSAYSANGVVFSCMLVRQLAFSSVRFRWQRLRGGKGADMFGTPDLSLLERPWPGGTTQDLLARVIQDADLAGNSFWTRDGAELVRLRPDWVEIAAEPRRLAGGQVGWRRIGYLYTEGGPNSGARPAAFLAEDVAHFAPIPDPLAAFRGMSWLTPVIREIQADQVMTRHKRKFFENGATPNMIVKHQMNASPEKIQAFADMMHAKHGGSENAYKTLHLYPGADATVVGADFRQIDFKTVQGAGETRIAAAARVPPVIAGLSEGLQGSSLNQGNYQAARRSFADGAIHPLWQNVAGSLAPLIPSQGADTRLWYDASDVPLLREDEKDAADIAFAQAQTIRQLIDAGYEPDTVVQAIESGDWRALRHSGLYSVQLQAPGSGLPQAPMTGDDDA